MLIILHYHQNVLIKLRKTPTWTERVECHSNHMPGWFAGFRSHAVSRHLPQSYQRRNVGIFKSDLYRVGLYLQSRCTVLDRMLFLCLQQGILAGKVYESLLSIMCLHAEKKIQKNQKEINYTEMRLSKCLNKYICGIGICVLIY